MKNLSAERLRTGIFITLSLFIFSCNSNEKVPATVNSTFPAAAPNDTTMPREPASAMVSQSDSITPKARKADKDSIGSKISIHKGEVKVVDTVKGSHQAH